MTDIKAKAREILAAHELVSVTSGLPVAKPTLESAYIDLCVSSSADLARKLLMAVEALEDIAYRISSSGEDPEGGPCRISISNDRNDRILKAKSTLDQINGKAEG